MLDRISPVEKITIIGGIVAIFGATITLVSKSISWLVNFNLEHKNLMEHMHATITLPSEVPIIKQQVITLQSSQDALLEEIKLLRADINRFVQLLIEKLGN